MHRPKSHHGAAPRGSRQAEHRRRPPRIRTAAEKAKKSVADAARHARNKSEMQRALKAAVEEKEYAEMAKMDAESAARGQAQVTQAAEYRWTSFKHINTHTD